MEKSGSQAFATERLLFSSSIGMKTRNTHEKRLEVQRVAFTNRYENIFNNLEGHLVLWVPLRFLVSTAFCT